MLSARSFGRRANSEKRDGNWIRIQESSEDTRKQRGEGEKMRKNI